MYLTCSGQDVFDLEFVCAPFFLIVAEINQDDTVREWPMPLLTTISSFKHWIKMSSLL